MPARPWPLLSILAIIGFYIELDVGAFGGILPNVIGAPFGLALVIIHFRRINVQAAFFAGLLVLLYFVGCVLAAARAGGGISMIQPAGQILYSLVTAYGVFLDISLWRRQDVRRLFGWFIGVILAGCFLEVYTPFKIIADKFQILHTFVRASRQDVWVMARDIALYGRPRPRFFTSEASFVATNFGLFTSAWLLTAPNFNTKRLIEAAIVIVAGLFVMRSPFCILPVLIVGADLFFNRERNKGRLMFSLAEMAIFGLLATFALVGIGALFLTLFSQRVTTVKDWSVIVRTYGAVAAGFEVAKHYPVFGAGAGNFDGIREIVAQVYLRLQVPDYVVMTELLAKSLNNGLGATLAWFGFGGAVIYFGIQSALGRSLAPAVRGTFVLAILLVVYQTAGNIYSPKGVWPLFLILGVMVSKDAVAVASETQVQTRARRFSVRWMNAAHIRLRGLSGGPAPAE